MSRGGLESLSDRSSKIRLFPSSHKTHSTVQCSNLIFFVLVHPISLVPLVLGNGMLCAYLITSVIFSLLLFIPCGALFTITPLFSIHASLASVACFFFCSAFLDKPLCSSPPSVNTSGPLVTALSTPVKKLKSRFSALGVASLERLM